MVEKRRRYTKKSYNADFLKIDLELDLFLFEMCAYDEKKKHL